MIRSGDIHGYLTALAVQAGADPELARERMAQAATVWTLESSALEEALEEAMEAARRWKAVAEAGAAIADAAAPFQHSDTCDCSGCRSSVDAPIDRADMGEEPAA